MADRSLTVRLRAEVDQYRQSMSEAAKATEGVGKAAENAGRSSKALDLLGQAGRDVGQIIGAATGAAAAGMVALTAATIATGVQYNTLEQTSRAALTTLLGSAEAANEQMDKLREFGSTSPFPRQVWIEAQQQLLAFGMQAERIIPTLSAIQDAVAAAGGGAVDIQEIVRVLAQVQSTGKVTAETLNQLGTRGVDAAALIGPAFGQSAAEIRDSISSGAIDAATFLETLTEQMTARFGGAAANVRDTWVGATDRIKGALRDIGSVVVTPFIDPSGGGAAVEWANRLADALRALESILRDVVPVLREQAGPAFDRVTVAMERAAEAIRATDLVSIVERLRDAGPILTAFGAAAAAAGGNAAMSVVGLGSLAGVVSPLGAGIAALAVASPELRGALVDLFEAVSPLIPVLAEVAVLLADALAAGVGEVSWLIGEAAKGIASVVELFRMLPEPIQQATLALGAFALALKFGGPVGVAITAIAALGVAVKSLQGGFGSAADEADQMIGRVRLLAEDLERFGRNGHANVAVQEVIGTIQQMGEEIRRATDPTFWERMWDSIRNIGNQKPWEDPIDPVAADIAADYADKLKGVDLQLAALVSGGNTQAAERAFDRLAAEAEAAGIPTDVLIGLLPEYAAELERAGHRTEDAAEAQARFAAETDSVTGALREYHAELRAAADPIFRLQKAIGDAESAQLALNEAIETHGKDSPEAREAALDYAAAVLELEDAALAASGVVDDKFIASMLASMEAAGASEETMRLVEEALRAVAEAGEGIEDRYETTVVAHGVDGVISRLQFLQNFVDNLDGREIDIRVQAPVAGGPRLPTYDVGGPVLAPRGVGQPAVVHGGEHVWTAAEVDAMGGHGAVAALRAAALAGQSRYAVSAPVGVVPMAAGGDGAVAGGNFTGQLFLDSGELVGMVDGRIEAHDRQVARRVRAGTGAVR